jgi:hypothetical protein
MNCRRVDVDSQARLPWFPPFNRFIGPAILFAIVVGVSLGPNAHAVVVVQDTFDDADRDNDGFQDDSNGGPVQGTADGIPWFRVNPRFFGDPNPTFLIIDDSVHPVTNPDGIGTGNALAINQTPQSSADWAGFFGQTITLGPNVGDKLVVSFDTRNLDLGNPDSVQGSQFTTLRFGLWQDSDNQLGTQTTDGDGITATWGGNDGHFDNCDTSAIGTCGDYGVWGRVQSGAVPDTAPGPLTPPDLDANDFSIAEEFNAQISMGGNDFETVALPDAVDDALMGDYNGDGSVDAADYVVWRKDPASFGGDPDGYNTWRADFGASGDSNALFSDIPIVLIAPHTLSLTLERVAPDASGQDVLMEVAVDGIGFGAQPSDTPGGIATRDSFDYFMLTHNTPMDFYLIDNFKVELIAATSGSGATAVPEPASLQLAILLLLSALVACRRCQ